MSTSTPPCGTSGRPEHPDISDASTTPSPDRFPLAALAIMALTGFVTLLTETLPAGLLPEMSAELGRTPSQLGLTVTLFALGCVVSAVPLSRATARLSRRTVLLGTIALFLVANTATALLSWFPLLLAARFVAGMSAGLVWAILPSYSRRIAPAGRQGLALSVALSGGTFALAIGVPAGTALDQLAGWRLAFGIMSVIAVVLFLAAWRVLPDTPGSAAGVGSGIGAALRIPAVLAVLTVLAFVVVGHNTVYTYIAPVLAAWNADGQRSLILTVFGVASVAGVFLTGRFLDRLLFPQLLTATGGVAIALLMLTLSGGALVPVQVGAVLWGLVFGGMASVIQTVAATVAGTAADSAQALLVTAWNLSIAAGGALGGALLAGPGVDGVLVAGTLFAAVAFVVAAVFVTGRRRRFGPGYGGLL
ncbi:MFS transporter [Mycetocola reblochoni]|uniref:Major facilitator family transporter n=2 Tax=Mycetocola reblochoni TaxID=331618 RepID=A0A1R4J101_9MICO|nr:MFS transporter [Mycetocola reblochoni]RLP68791.1 MFS transporter [Mycetocola reblochoni]SJN25333.1 Major facilitator family transporter [Mycetocola reblochoni REB411]